MEGEPASKTTKERKESNQNRLDGEEQQNDGMTRDERNQEGSRIEGKSAESKGREQNRKEELESTRRKGIEGMKWNSRDKTAIVSSLTREMDRLGLTGRSRPFSSFEVLFRILGRWGVPRSDEHLQI
jgi:hypothetical protein